MLVELFQSAGKKLEMSDRDAAVYDQKMQQYVEAQKAGDSEKDRQRAVPTGFPRYASPPALFGLPTQPSLAFRCQRAVATGAPRYARSAVHAYGMFWWRTMSFRKSQEAQLFEEVDMIEEKCFENEQCTAFGGSNKHLLAADFEDAWSDTLRLFNLCRCLTRWKETGGAASSSVCPTAGATKWERETCGLYFPAKMWTNTPPGTRKFYCKVNWEPLLMMPETGALMMFAWGVS